MMVVKNPRRIRRFMSRFAARGPLTELMAAARLIAGYYRGGHIDSVAIARQRRCVRYLIVGR